MFWRFSALQRAEIAEILITGAMWVLGISVSVLFNEPKLLKCLAPAHVPDRRAEFQCSSTSRNC